MPRAAFGLVFEAHAMARSCSSVHSQMERWSPSLNPQQSPSDRVCDLTTVFCVRAAKGSSRRSACRPKSTTLSQRSSTPCSRDTPSGQCRSRFARRQRWTAVAAAAAAAARRAARAAGRARRTRKVTTMTTAAEAARRRADRRIRRRRPPRSASSARPTRRLRRSRSSRSGGEVLRPHITQHTRVRLADGSHHSTSHHGVE